MNAGTSLRSLKSGRSSRSEKVTRTASVEGEVGFEEYINEVCRRFNMPIAVVVVKNRSRGKNIPISRLQL